MFVRIVCVFFTRFLYPSILKKLFLILYIRSTYGYYSKINLTKIFYNLFPKLRPAVIFCHDYYTIDFAYELNRKHKIPYYVDCHEYSVGQFPEDKMWSKWVSPTVKVIQDIYLPNASGISTVSKGISKFLANDHKLKIPPLVLRSVPFYERQPFNKTGKKIKVLYHGEIYKTRSLDYAVRSLKYTNKNIHLTLRGYGDENYKKELLEIAKNCGCEKRITIEEPVPFDKIISFANNHDIGYFVSSKFSPQRKHTLPNKFFEYIMAGLCLFVSDVPEMSKIIKQYKCGILAKNLDERLIANMLNNLTPSKIDDMKKNSLEAAKKFNWEKEEAKLKKWNIS